VRRDYFAWRRDNHLDSTVPTEPRRRVADLRAGVEAAQQRRQAREQREREAAEAEKRQARAAYLEQVFQDLERHWQQAERQADLGSGRSYQEATRLLRDLADAYHQHDRRAQFGERFATFLEKHRRRRKLLERLRKAGLPVDD